MLGKNLKTDDHLIMGKEVYNIVSCAFEVQNNLGNGFWEKPYENALVVELKKRKIPFLQQSHFKINYKGHIVGEYVPDLIVNNQIVVEVKVIDSITKNERAQILHYLKITDMKVGLILNFKHQKIQWERFVL